MNGSISIIFFFVCLFLAYRKAINLFKLILHPTITEIVCHFQKFSDRIFGDIISSEMGIVWLPLSLFEYPFFLFLSLLIQLVCQAQYWKGVGILASLSYFRFQLYCFKFFSISNDVGYGFFVYSFYYVEIYSLKSYTL